ncbi:MAG: DUF3592 domain-containing protein [Ruminococcus sp.]|nr:DUF3592 domain-containing protein [Ruminococcus sp.]
MAIALFLFGLGVILVIVAPIGKKKNNRCSAQTQGTLIDIRKRYNSNGVLPSMKEYSYRVNGIEYRLKSTAVNPNADKVGDQCPIWYDPKNPKDALEYRSQSNKLFNILLIIGIVMILASLVIPVISIGLQNS